MIGLSSRLSQMQRQRVNIMKKNMRNKVASEGNDIRGCTEGTGEREREGGRKANHPRVISCQFSPLYQNEAHCGVPTKGERKGNIRVLAQPRQWHIVVVECRPRTSAWGHWQTQVCRRIGSRHRQPLVEFHRIVPSNPKEWRRIPQCHRLPWQHRLSHFGITSPEQSSSTIESTSTSTLSSRSKVTVLECRVE